MMMCRPGQFNHLASMAFTNTDLAHRLYGGAKLGLPVVEGLISNAVFPANFLIGRPASAAFRIATICYPV